MNPETAACAAIMLASGTIVAGRRHHDCLLMLHVSGLSRFNIVQGFMTTHGRFVPRFEAFRLQKLAGIPSADPGGYRGLELYSEDLY